MSEKVIASSDSVDPKSDCSLSYVRSCIIVQHLAKGFEFCLAALGFKELFNPLPDMPNLGSSNSAGNKDMMSKIWKNRDTII